MLGVDAAPHHAVVQGAGAAWRMERPYFPVSSNTAGTSTASEPLLVRNAEAVGADGRLHRFHLVEARLARWLLMTRDRGARR